ncbi:MAG: integrase [Rhizobiales bacterium 62-47]|nr:tyrosine-type recombinase/integrase [Hyphomicrobiales bacterium]OJY09702.1 MAG: integrase [Rhizobiales bacterium 62-47]
MPQVKLTKTAIDALPTPTTDTVYWDAGCPGFGIKVTPKGRKVFIVLYRTAGAGSRLRKFAIGPYGRVTLNQARVTAQKVFAAKLDGRDLAAEKKESRRRMVADRIDDLLEAYIAQHVVHNRSGPEISRMLRREIGSEWGARSIHEISKRDAIDIVTAIEHRGAPIAANKALKAIKTFLRWCVGRAVLDRSPADDVPLPAKQITRDRVLSDDELGRIILAARRLGCHYGDTVEMLALTGQRREEVARCTWAEIDLTAQIWRIPSERTKNGKAHEVYLSDQAVAVLARAKSEAQFVFSKTGQFAFQGFGPSKRKLDVLANVTGWRLHDLRRTCVSGMARLGTAPHVADKILNHQSGTISGVAAVYQRHDFLAERRKALEIWGAHVAFVVDTLRAEQSETRKAA